MSFLTDQCKFRLCTLMNSWIASISNRTKFFFLVPVPAQGMRTDGSSPVSETLYTHGSEHFRIRATCFGFRSSNGNGRSFPISSPSVRPSVVTGRVSGSHLFSSRGLARGLQICPTIALLDLAIGLPLTMNQGLSLSLWLSATASQAL